MTDIRVPTLGESVTEATVGKWFKQPGDAVAVDEPLVELETDKVTLEVPAPAAGVLSDVAVKNGDTVAVGALLGQIKEGAGAAPKASAPAAKPAEVSKPAPAAPQKSPEMPVPSGGNWPPWNALKVASPAARATTTAARNRPGDGGSLIACSGRAG